MNKPGLFEPGNIPFEKLAKDTVFADMGYLCHAAEANGLPVHDLGENFNFHGALIKARGLDNDDVFIFHLTSALSTEERIETANLIHQRFTDILSEDLTGNES